ncbi:COX15/CtaA family protein [Salinibacterium sp. SYSU T00001]|nr:COX15/CtaA family protein [Salinibacterium sedimenticola]
MRVAAWLSFCAEVLIIATGGAVRLTGSGLGCSEWPLCTPESLVPTEAMGFHGVIEFGNRTLTGLVGILAIIVLLTTLRAVGGRRSLAAALWFALGALGAGAAAWGLAAVAGFTGAAGFPFFTGGLILVTVAGAVHSLRTVPERRDLAALAWVVLIGVMAQAFVGGITVLTQLNPFIVGFHYTLSVVLVSVTAAYLVRMSDVPGPRELAVPLWFAILSHATGLALAATIFFGVLTTGSGPHSGDANVIREGFDASALAHVHSWPGYVLALLVAVLTAAAWALRLPLRRWLVVLALVIVVQVVVGVAQARNGLPPLLVGIHMVLAALSAAAYTVIVLRLKRPANPSVDGVASAGASSTVPAK